jgi:hypothetical protein
MSMSVLSRSRLWSAHPFRTGPLITSLLIAMGPENEPHLWTAGPISLLYPRRKHQDDSGQTDEPGVYRLDGHLRGAFTAHIRERRRSCRATRASHRPPRASRKDRGPSRPRRWRTAANSVSPLREPLTKSSSTEVGPMPAPPTSAAPGRAPCGISPSSSAGPVFSSRAPHVDGRAQLADIPSSASPRRRLRPEQSPLEQPLPDLSRADSQRHKLTRQP